MKFAAIVFLTLVIGVFLGSFIESNTNVEIIPDNNISITYIDFISILLSSVTAVVSILGILIAILAFIGWQTIGRKVEQTSERLMSEAVGDGGSLHNTVKKEVNRIMYREINPIDTEFEEQKDD